ELVLGSTASGLHESEHVQAVVGLRSSSPDPPSPPTTAEKAVSILQSPAANGHAEAAADKINATASSSAADDDKRALQLHSFEFFAAHDPLGIELYRLYCELKDKCKASRDELKLLVRELNNHKAA